MNCQNCNNPVNTNENFCRHCGTKININNQQQYTQMQSQTQVQQQPYYQPQQEISVSEKIDHIMNNLVIDPEEEMVDAYIGEKANEMKNGFSWCTFLFGVAYPFYRKMWGFGFVLLLINVVVSIFIPGASTAVKVIAAVIFKEMYLNTVKKRVNDIKEKNPGKTHEELLTICSKKGGTSVLAVILLGFFYAALVGAIIIIFFTLAITDSDLLKYGMETKNISLDTVSLSIPSKMSETINSSDWYAVTYNNSKENCRIDIYKVNPEQCTTPSECIINLNESGVEYGPFTQKYVNDKGWNYRKGERTQFSSELPNEYEYYFTKINETIYAVEYKSVTEDDVCTLAKGLLEQTITYSSNDL